MRSPVLALLWHNGRCFQWSLLCAACFMAAITAVCASVAPLNAGDPAAMNDAAYAHAICVWGTLLLTALLCASLAGDKMRNFSLPRHIVAMPVRNCTFAAVYTLSTAAVIGVAALVMTVVHIALFSPTVNFAHGMGLSLWKTPLFCIYMALMLQAVAFWIGSTGRESLQAILSVILLPATVVVSILATSLSPSPLYPFVWLSGSFVAYLLSWSAIAVERHGFWESVPVRLSSLIPATASHSSVRRFRTARQAIAWYEWKRFFRYFPLFLLAFVIVGFTEHLLVRTSDPGFVAIVCVSVLLVATGLNGFITIRHHYDGITGLNNFIFSLPVKNRVLASSRIAIAARTLILTNAMAFLVVFARLAVLALTPGIKHNPWEMVLAGCYSILVTLAGWTLLWFAVPLAYFFVALALVSWVSVLVSGLSIDLVTAYIAWASLVCFPILEFGIAIVALRRQLIGRKTLLLIVALWLLPLGPIFYLNQHKMLPLGIALALLPALPLITAPLSIEWRRNRW